MGAGEGMVGVAGWGIWLGGVGNVWGLVAQGSVDSSRWRVDGDSYCYYQIGWARAVVIAVS